MACFLEKRVPSEHIGHERHRAIEFNCPALDGMTICLWCCLHIEELADPSRRLIAEDNHKEYSEVVPLAANKGWDEMWQHCSGCTMRQSSM